MHKENIGFEQAEKAARHLYIKYISILLVILFFTTVIIHKEIYAFESPQKVSEENGNNLARELAKFEVSGMRRDLESWTDQKTIKGLSNTAVTDDSVKKLYLEFKNTIIAPRNPVEYKEYGIENAEESLMKVEQLGRRIHNRLFVLSDKASARYADLLRSMRDVLYLDAKHIPMAIRGDNSRDVYWYNLHAKWLNYAEGEYLKIFCADNVAGHDGTR